MNFEYLREFLDLASTLNFTKSASNLHMTQSTLSRHISAMEKEVGFPLFTRSTSKVKLTQNGACSTRNRAHCSAITRTSSKR